MDNPFQSILSIKENFFVSNVEDVKRVPIVSTILGDVWNRDKNIGYRMDDLEYLGNKSISSETEYITDISHNQQDDQHTRYCEQQQDDQQQDDQHTRYCEQQQDDQQQDDQHTRYCDQHTRYCDQHTRYCDQQQDDQHTRYCDQQQDDQHTRYCDQQQQEEHREQKPKCLYESMSTFCLYGECPQQDICEESRKLCQEEISSKRDMLNHPTTGYKSVEYLDDISNGNIQDEGSCSPNILEPSYLSSLYGEQMYKSHCKNRCTTGRYIPHLSEDVEIDRCSGEPEYECHIHTNASEVYSTNTSGMEAVEAVNAGKNMLVKHIFTARLTRLLDHIDHVDRYGDVEKDFLGETFPNCQTVDSEELLENFLFRKGLQGHFVHRETLSDLYENGEFERIIDDLKDENIHDIDDVELREFMEDMLEDSSDISPFVRRNTLFHQSVLTHIRLTSHHDPLKYRMYLKLMDSAHTEIARESL